MIFRVLIGYLENFNRPILQIFIDSKPRVDQDKPISQERISSWSHKMPVKAPLPNLGLHNRDMSWSSRLLSLGFTQKLESRSQNPERIQQ